MPGKRILLVDYDPRSLTHTREVLEGAGFDVSTCGDGLSALDQFRSLNPDLVLLSAMLPKMHGFEVCSNIRKLPGGERTPVVIITDVYKGKRYRIDAINKYGATEYIEKPIEDANLVDILKGLVKANGRSPAFEDGERTVQFSREMLKSVREEVTGATRTGEKKVVSEKPKKDDISKKLEQSLAGLDLEIGKKARPKARPESEKPEPSLTAEEPAPTVQLSLSKDSSGSVFTSEDLFTDVIASVERELQSEKQAQNGPEPATVSEPVPQSPATIAMAVPTVNPAVAPPVSAPPVPEAAKAAPAAAAPTVAMPVPAAPPKVEPAKKHAFDTDLEKKLSSTLSGLKKEKTKAEPLLAKAPSAAPKIEAPRPAPVPPKPSEQPKQKVEPPAPTPAPVPKVEPPPAAEPAPTVQMEVKPVARPKLESKPGVTVPAKEAEKEPVAEGINFGQYLLLGKIATGGMAELFKAKRKGVEGFEKILAIKRILPHMSDNEEFVTMFIDEAKLAAQLTHHNICQIFDLGKIENSYYIAMEYVHGKDLRAVLKASRSKNKAMPVDLAVLIISKICSALDYAHRKKGMNGQLLNIVHRDVSPQNILISYEGDVKLVDFGIAKAATKAHVTQHGALKGKLLYMSPEQAWGKPVDKRADIFSVGTVLYELLTGRPLFFDDNDTEVTILEKVREAKVTPIREFNSRIPQELEKIVSKALKKNLEDRYYSAYDMQKDLDSLFYSESYSATSGTVANFMRDLFAEEWAQESDVKEIVAKEKEPEKAIQEAPVKPVERAPEKKSKKQQPVAAVVEPPPAAPAKEPEKKPEPVAPAPVEPADKKQPFRDISMPEIMAPAEKGSFPMIPAAIGAAILVFIGAYFLFRSKPETPEVTPPAQTAPANPAPSTTTPVPAPTPEATQQTPPAVVEPAKETAEDKKLAEKKAEEEKKKEEERKKQELAKLQEEQQKLAQQQQEQAKQEQAKQEPVQEQPAPAPPPAQEETKVAEVQQPPVQEPPKQEPVAEKEPAKQEQPAAEQVSVKEGDLVELTPDVVKPEVLTRKNPTYPPAALTKKVEGTVIVSVLVTESGKVADAKVLRGAGGSTGLNESAVAAVKGWTFRPAVKAGKKVKVWVTYPIVFKLGK